MYWRRIRLANWSKSRISWCLMLFSLVTGVGISFSPFESRLIWSVVSWILERFLMYCLLHSYVFLWRSLRAVFLRVLCVLFLIFRFSIFFPLLDLFVHSDNKQIPCRSSFSGGIIWSLHTGSFCGSGSYAVQFGDHFRSNDHFCRGSFAALYRFLSRDSWRGPS